MICYSHKCNKLSELRNYILGGGYDDSIRKNIYLYLRDQPHEFDSFDATEYFEIQAEVLELDKLLCLESENIRKHTLNEEEMFEIFSNRIKSIQKSITKEMLKDRFKDYENAKILFNIIEKLGYPKMLVTSSGISVFASFDSIEERESRIALKGSEVTLEISFLTDCLKRMPMLGGSFVETSLCYSIYNEYAEYSHIQIYWPA